MTRQEQHPSSCIPSDLRPFNVSPSGASFVVLRWTAQRPDKFHCLLEARGNVPSEQYINELDYMVKHVRRVNVTEADVVAAVARGTYAPDTFDPAASEWFDWDDVQLVGLSRVTPADPEIDDDGVMLFCASRAPIYKPVFFYVPCSLEDLRGFFAQADAPRAFHAMTRLPCASRVDTSAPANVSRPGQVQTAHISELFAQGIE